MQEIDLLAIGDSSIDEFMKVEEDSASEEHGEICFFHGTKIPVESFSTAVAGNAINVGVGTQTLQLETYVYSEIGDDANAERVIAQLKKREVHTDYVIKNKGTLTDVHPIIVYRGERTIFIYHEKRNYKVRDWPKPKWIYYSSIGRNFNEFQKELCEYLKTYPEVGMAFNPGTYHLKLGIDGIKDILSLTHILFLNKDETLGLLKESNNDFSLRELHEHLQEYGPKLTVITDGNNGSSAYDGENFIEMPVFEESTPIADKTGAGDAYSSGFLSAIFYKKPLKEAMLWGSINASGVIREMGAINGLRNQDQINNLLTKGKN